MMMTRWIGCVLVLAVAVSTLGGCGSDGSADTTFDVLLVYDWPNGATRLADVQSKLLAFGVVVTGFDAVLGTPTLPDLAAYDAVLVSTDSGPADPAALGDVLADHVDAGGAVALAVFSTCFGIAGRFDTSDYRTIPETAQVDGDGPLTLGISLAHPIMTGVTTFDGGADSFRADTSAVHAMATSVASWSDGTTLVATRTDLAARRVDVNFYPPTSDVSGGFVDASSDAMRLLANALLWVAGRI